MVGPDGKVGPNRHRDTAHVPERRIGDILDADDDAGSGKVVRVTFAPEDGGPRVTLQMTFASVAEVEMTRGSGAEAPGLQTLGKLARAVGAV